MSRRSSCIVSYQKSGKGAAKDCIIGAFVKQVEMGRYCCQWSSIDKVEKRGCKLDAQ